MGFLSCKLVQAASSSYLLIFLGKPHLLIVVKIKDMFGKYFHRNGMKRILSLSRVPATAFYVMLC